MSYNNSHRALLQAIMQRGAVSSVDAKELVIKFFGTNQSPSIYIHQINVQLEPFNMMIKDVACELTGEKYWILVSTVLDEITRFQTEFSPAQLELVRKILCEIVRSIDGSIPSTVCLNLCSTLENTMSKVDAEHFLTTMIEKKWFVDQNGKIHMGVRCVAELLPYFRATYDEDVFHTCSLCRQVVFHGERCNRCQEVLHLYCFANTARVQKPPKCPSCNNIMTTEKIQGFQGCDYVVDLPALSQDTPTNRSEKRQSTRKRKQEGL